MTWIAIGFVSSVLLIYFGSGLLFTERPRRPEHR